ncbi:MAG TPA: glycosyltransferase 87 family protein, partial [bacterium]|nr:glycosyltransferase 87 family protein [bacterium]
LAGAGRTRAAALVLAAATAIKFYPALFVLPFALRRDFRFLAWFGGGWLALGLLLPALAFGPGDTVKLYREAAANMETDRAKITVDMNSQYVPHVVERWKHRLAGEARPLGKEGSPLRTALRAAATVVFLVHLGLVGLRARRNPDPVPTFALLTLSIPFLIPTAWPHYFVFLPFFQAWAAWRLRERGPAAKIGWGALLAASVVASSTVGYRLAGDWWTYSHAGAPALASLALLIVIHSVVRRPEPVRV